MNKVNIKKFENFEDSIIRRNQSSENTYRFGQSEKSQIIKSISEHQEIQSKLCMVDLDTRIDALQKLSEFNKEIFESNDNKMKKFGKILDGVGLTTALILSLFGAHILATGGNVTPVLLGIICSTVISGIGLSIHKKSE
jgi:hypothetical protein